MKNDVETHNCVSSLNKTGPYGTDDETQLRVSIPLIMTFSLAQTASEEVTTSGVTVRGDSIYSIYSVAALLQQITASIGQRYVTQQVRVMGFANSRSDKGHNRELSEKRAEAVKNCLVGTGKIDAARVSVEPMGESSNQWHLTPLPWAARKAVASRLPCAPDNPKHPAFWLFQGPSCSELVLTHISGLVELSGEADAFDE